MSRLLQNSLRTCLLLAGIGGAGTHIASAQTPVPVAPNPTPAAAEVRVAQPNAARFPEVTLYLNPVDARQRYVPGLERLPGAFRVQEDGKPAQILSVTSSGNYLDVCLTLDCSYSMVANDKLQYGKTAAALFAQQLGPEDQAALVSFSSGSTLERPLGRDKAELQAAIQRMKPTGTTTTFYDALYWSITQVALRSGGSVVAAGGSRAEARRVVVALTDGQDLSSRIQVDELVTYARANGVALCVVALGPDAERNRLRWFAQETGGIYLDAPTPQDLERLYSTLAQELRREYRLTYRTPKPQADATRREVTVEVTGTPATGKTWYQAPGQGSLLVTVPSAATAGGSVGAAGASNSPAMPLGTALMILAGIAALAGVAVMVVLRLRADPVRLPVHDTNPRIDLMPLWVREGCTRVGRGAECELVLDSNQVSREHARIEAASGAFRLVDEGSRNGTYVNGQRVKGDRLIHPGDRIRFGDREFSFAGEQSA